MKENTKGKLAYCASNAHDLERDQRTSQSDFVGKKDGLLREKNRRNHSLVRAGRCGAGKFSTRSSGHDGFSRGRRPI